MAYQTLRRSTNARGKENRMKQIERVFLRPVEAAAALGIGRSKVYELLARGAIPHVRIDNLMRIPRAWLDRQVRVALEGADETEGADQR
jgi:excisionase family DNA binding protein